MTTLDLFAPPPEPKAEATAPRRRRREPGAQAPGMNPQDRLDALRMDLDEAWRRVAAVPGPELGDRRAPLAARVAAFSARIQAFRSVMVR